MSNQPSGQTEYQATNLEDAQRILQSLPPGTEATIIMETANGSSVGVKTTSDEVAMDVDTSAPETITGTSSARGGDFSLSAKLTQVSGSIGLTLCILGVLIALGGGALIWLRRLVAGFIGVGVGLGLIALGLFGNPAVIMGLGGLAVIGLIIWFVWDQYEGNKLEAVNQKTSKALSVVTKVVESLEPNIKDAVKKAVAESPNNSPEVRTVIREAKK